MINKYTVPGIAQYTKIDDKTITHDANGNFKSDSVTNYTYDVENRLISVVGAHNGLLHYDPMGRLYKINAHDTGKTTYFLYSGDSLIAEYQSGRMTQRYVHGGGGLAPLVGYDGSSTAAAYLRFLHFNHQGSVIAQSNNSGAVTNINTYDEYGVPGTGNAGRFSYTGQMHLPEIGLYHYRARMYNPFTGRFLQTDPVGYADQMNLYAYVHNDPLNYTDPTGEFGVIGFAIGFIADAAAQRIATGSVDWRQSVVSGAVGAVTGGAASLAKASMVVGGKVVASAGQKAAAAAYTASTGAVAAATGHVVNSELKGEQATLKSTATDAVMNASGPGKAASKVVGAAASVAKEFSSAVKSEVGEVATKAAQEASVL